MKRLLSLFVILIAFSAYAQKPYALDPEAKGPRSGIDIEHMLLNISFRPEDGLVYGDVTHTFKTKTDKLDTIFLNGPGIDYKSVQYDGKDVKYTTNKDGIVISPGKKLRLNEEHTVRITYEARPRKGIYFIGWKDTTYGIPVNNHGKELHVSLNQSGIVRRQIWTQGQSEDNRYWLPIDDDPNDKLTTEMKITFAKEDMSQVRDKANSTFRVLSNGEKEDSTDNGNGTITWRYACKKPFAPYLIMIGIGDYGVKPDQNANGVPLQYWYYPNQASAVGPTYKYTPQIMNFYEQEIGIPFQWPKYAQIPVQDFIYGAMENVSATVYGDFFYVTPRQSIDQNYIMVNAHEMAHQWFGDVVTAKSYKDEWLQEGFATHYAKLAERSLFGEDFYQWNRRQEQNTALAASTKNLMPIVNTNGGSGRIYQKASFVLDMLKDTVGRENYNKVVKAYIEKYGFANASTQDFADMFKQWLNMDLQWFFDEWIFRGGEPHYKVSYEDLPQKSQSVTRVHVQQTQQLDSFTNYFSMPIRVDVHYTDGTMDWKKQWVNSADATIEIPNAHSKTIDYVLFDPGSHILKSVEFDKPIDQLKSQAIKAPEMIDRYDAVEGMKNFGYYLKRGFFDTLFSKNPFHAIQEQIVMQMAPDTDAASRNLMLKAIKDNDATVRAEAVKDIQNLPDSLRPAFEMLLQDSSLNVVGEALKKLTTLFPNRTQQYLDQTADAAKQSLNNNLMATWLHIAIASGQKQYLPMLEDYLSPMFEFRTRLNAMNAMRDLNMWDQRSAFFLLQAASSWNSRLAGPAQDVIKSMIKGGNKDLLTKAYNSTRWTDAEKAILTDVLK